MKVVGRNILLEVPKVEERTESGIIKSDAQLEEERQNIDKFLKVLAVGPDVVSVKEGDKVMAGVPKLGVYELEDKLYSVVSELSILFIK